MISENAYAQAYCIINEMSEELKNKIPNDIKNTIDIKRNKKYKFSVDESFENMELLEDTGKLLSVIYTDYLASQEEKEFIFSKEKTIEKIIKGNS